MFAAGGRLFDRQEDPQGSTFHEPPEQEALSYLGDLVNKHRVAPTASEDTATGGNDKGFATGKIVLNMRNVPITTWESLITNFNWAAAAAGGPGRPIERRQRPRDVHVGHHQEEGRRLGLYVLVR